MPTMGVKVWSGIKKNITHQRGHQAKMLFNLAARDTKLDCQSIPEQDAVPHLTGPAWLTSQELPWSPWWWRLLKKYSAALLVSSTHGLTKAGAVKHSYSNMMTRFGIFTVLPAQNIRLIIPRRIQKRPLWPHYYKCVDQWLPSKLPCMEL